AASTSGLWKGVRTDADDVDKAVKFSGAIAMALANFHGSEGEASAFRVALEHLLGAANDRLRPGGKLTSAGEEYFKAWASLQPALDRLFDVGMVEEADRVTLGDEPLQGLLERCIQVRGLEGKLSTWCAWRKVRAESLAVGLEPVSLALEGEVLAPGTLRRAFETDYSRWWLNATVDQEEVVRTFVSAEHEKRIGDFRALDEQFTQLTRAWVRAGLCAELPKPDDVSRNSEWGLLKYE